MHEKIKKLSLTEKAKICSGKNFWELEPVPELNIPSYMVTDGPHGLRKQAQNADHLGINLSEKATCFPPAVCSASSWDPELLYQMGKAIGEECAAENVAVVLGPGTNIKRSPLCGRNFEYFSEDPLLAGKMSAAWVAGVQSQKRGTSLKHYAVNSQEKARMISNSVVDERALREIYLTPFEICVKSSQPWTLMCAYNRVNNIYACENPYLLNEILREEWDFAGYVMTDWGAMNDRVEALEAGLELQMPGPADYNTQLIIDAVENGRLDEAVLDRAVERILMTMSQVGKDNDSYDKKTHHDLARRIAAESAVLLKNEEQLLPLKGGESLAVIGEFAKMPRYQGSGSSQINPHRLDNLYDELKAKDVDFDYAQGYRINSDETDKDLMNEAVETAKDKDRVILLLGLPDRYESEGFDREHMNLPESHNALLEAVAKVNDNLIVVLLCGAPVLLPWHKKVKTILLPYLGGQASGSALAANLLGEIEPSGRLAETFPLALEDTPAYGNFATDDLNVLYKESIFVGYRFYDWADKEVLYPFGHGLGYSTFKFREIKAFWDEIKEEGYCSCIVQNSGERTGKTVVQLYVGLEKSAVMRAPRELRGFKKVALKPGEEQEVRIPLNRRTFAYYSPESAGWKIEKGRYRIELAASSRDIRLATEIELEGDAKVNATYIYDKEDVLKDGHLQVSDEAFAQLFPKGLPIHNYSEPVNKSTSIKDVLATEKGRELLSPIIKKFKQNFSGENSADIMFISMLEDAPLRSMVMLAGASMKDVLKIVDSLNEEK